MDWSWATAGVSTEVPRTSGPECANYMTNRRRWIESVILTILFIYITRWAVRRLKPIVLPSSKQLDKPHSPMRLMLLIAMTLVFGIEMGFKLSEKTVIFVLNPCHIQTMVQIYLLAAKPSKTTTALFRIQMNNLNGPVLAFLFPEVECRTLPFEQATYWIQHALLFIIPAYILKTGAYTVEEFTDFNWVTIGVMIMLIYHFTVLNILSIITSINLNHMLCAALADPFQGQNYRIAAVIHESILCPILNKVTVLLFSSKNSITHDTNSSSSSISYNKSSLSLNSSNSNMAAASGHHMSTVSKSNNMPLATTTTAAAATITNNRKMQDNTQTDAFLYHQQQQHQQQQMPTTQTQQLHYNNDKIPLASSTSNVSSIKQRFVPARRTSEDTADIELAATTSSTTTTTATNITAEFTMPTTKID